MFFFFGKEEPIGKNQYWFYKQLTSLSLTRAHQTSHFLYCITYIFNQIFSFIVEIEDAINYSSDSCSYEHDDHDGHSNNQNSSQPDSTDTEVIWLSLLKYRQSVCSLLNPMMIYSDFLDYKFGGVSLDLKLNEDIFFMRNTDCLMVIKCCNIRFYYELYIYLYFSFCVCYYS